LHERVDFTERMLSSHDRSALGKGETA
jgi:hypothetical protein